jgi:hypothetical protein
MPSRPSAATAMPTMFAPVMGSEPGTVAVVEPLPLPLPGPEPEPGPLPGPEPEPEPGPLPGGVPGEIWPPGGGVWW